MTTQSQELEIRAFENYIRGIECRSGEIQLTEGNNGGIVPKFIYDRIITGVKDRVDWLNYCRIVVCNGELAVPIYTEDSTNYINADYVTEGSSLTDNIGTINTVNLHGYIIGAMVLVSKKLVNNTSANIVDFVCEEIIEKIADKLNDEFTNGTSNIKGVLKNATKFVISNASTAITLNDLIELKHSVKKTYRRFSMWIMNDATWKAICKLEDNAGRKVVGYNDMDLLGFPVLINENMTDSITGSGRVIIFGDLSGYTIKFSDYIEISNLKERFAKKHMEAIMGFMEIDGKITNMNKLSYLKMKPFTRNLSRTATNCSVTVTKGTTTITDGDNKVSDEDILTITATASDGYELSTLTVNGDDFVSGEDFTVDGSNVVIVATATEIVVPDSNDDNNDDNENNPSDDTEPTP